MEINSEFRILFIARKILGIVSILGIGCLFINFTFEKKEWEILFLTISLGLISLFFLVKNLLKVYTIKIVENGIYKTSIFSKKSQFVSYKEIEKVSLEKVQGLSTDAGEISLGYFESVLITYKNQKIVISPDHFENYNEIMKAIKFSRNPAARSLPTSCP